MAKDDPADVLEWQLAASGHGQSSLSVRVRAGPTGVKKQDRQKPSFTGSARVFGKPGQSFLVCAQSLDAEDFFQEAVAPATPAANVYLLRLGGTVGKLTIDQGQPCPEYFGHQYPFVSGLHIRSDNVFSVVAKRADPPNDKTQDNNDKLIPPLNLPAKLSSRLGLSGGGQGTDDHNDFKRPPFMPVPDKMMAQLLLLPALNLPANWRDYLPFASLYHWFAGTGNPGITLLIRFNNEPALRLDISQAEFRELSPILPDVPQLLHWLAPKLSGREYLVQQLAELLTPEGEALLPELPESARAVIERQLAIILEQPDITFSLEFEYSQLQSALREQEQPPGVVELGGGMSKMPNLFIGQGADQPGNSDNPAKRQNNQHSQWQASQNPTTPDNEMIIPNFAINLAPSEYSILVAHQTRYHVDNWEVLRQWPDPISAGSLQLECQDCRQQICPMEIVNHAQSHQLTCAECGEFQPGTVPLETRQARLDCHARSHCRDFRAKVPPMPAADASLTTLRFMLRFGTEETLLKLLPEITQQSMIAALGQTDHEGRTFAHDLAMYSPDSVTLTMMESLNSLGKAKHLAVRDIYGKTPLNYMLLDRSQDFILKIRNYLKLTSLSTHSHPSLGLRVQGERDPGVNREVMSRQVFSAHLDKQITHDDKTAIDLPGERDETDLIDTLMGDSHLLIIIPPVGHSDPYWSLLPDEILISIFSLLPLKDLFSCRVVNKRAYNLIQSHSHHLVRDALWVDRSPFADLFSWDAWEKSISLSLGTKQDDGPERNEKSKKMVAHLEACKGHKNFHKILFYTLATIKPRASWSFQLSGLMKCRRNLREFVFSPNGRFLVTFWESRAFCINLWQGNSFGQEVFQEELYSDDIRGISFSPDSRTLAVCARQGFTFTLVLVAVENDKWQEVHRVEYDKFFFRLMVFSPNSQALLVCTSCGNFILTCQGNNNWMELASLPYRQQIISACFTPDNQVLIVVMADMIAHIFLPGNIKLEVQRLQYKKKVVRASFSPDGRALAIMVHNQKDLHYEVFILICQGAEIKILPEPMIIHRLPKFSFSPDSQYLMLEWLDIAYIYSHRGKGIWEDVYRIDLGDHLFSSSVIFGPNSRSLITISSVWDEILCTVTTHVCNINGTWKKACETVLPLDSSFNSRVCFSPDGLALITFSGKNLRIYRIMLNIQES